MLDFQSILTFSHTHCIAICAFLVPCNLLATLQTMVLAGRERPQIETTRAASLALLPALIMVLHVLSWLVVGVVMAPTYILLGLGFTCFWINGWAIAHPPSLARLLRRLFFSAREGILIALQLSGQTSNLKS